MPRRPSRSSEDDIAELRRLRSDRQRRVESMLHEDMRRQTIGNAIYWLVVVGGSLLINVFVLLAVAR
jgi:hypothetical protein